MSDTIGLMQPGPTLAAEEELKRKRRGLLGATWEELIKPTAKQAATGAAFVGRAVPHPAVAFPSMMAYNLLTEDDPMIGLMQGGGDIVNRYIPGFSGVMKASLPAEKAGVSVTDEMRNAALVARLLRMRGDDSGFREFSQKYPHLNVNALGGVEYELNPQLINFQPRVQRAIERRGEGRSVSPIKGSMEEIYNAPEVFDILPQARNLPSQVAHATAQIGSHYSPAWQAQKKDALVIAPAWKESFQKGPEAALRVYNRAGDHEIAHVVDHLAGNWGRIGQGVVGSQEAVAAHMKSLPEWRKLTAVEQATIAKLLYTRSYPEVRATQAPGRRYMTLAERQDNPLALQPIEGLKETLFLDQGLTNMTDYQKRVLLARVQSLPSYPKILEEARIERLAKRLFKPQYYPDAIE